MLIKAIAAIAARFRGAGRLALAFVLGLRGQQLLLGVNVVLLTAGERGLVPMRLLLLSAPACTTLRVDAPAWLPMPAPALARSHPQAAACALHCSSALRAAPGQGRPGLPPAASPATMGAVSGATGWTPRPASGWLAVVARTTGTAAMSLCLLRPRGKCGCWHSSLLCSSCHPCLLPVLRVAGTPTGSVQSTCSSSSPWRGRRQAAAP